MIGRIIIVTVFGGCTGGLTVLLFNRWVFGSKQWSYLLTLNGTLSGTTGGECFPALRKELVVCPNLGMVATCSGCNTLDFWASLVVGTLGGLVYIGWHYLMLKFQLDDPLDAVAVHLGAGTSLCKYQTLPSQSSSFI